MFKHAQLESVKAFLHNPAYGALSRHARIQRALRQLILEGALGVGKPLPASRTLAQSLGVSRDTVEAAYGQLYAEGFIERRVGSGSFVSEHVKLHRPDGPRQSGRQARSSSPTTPLLSRRGAAILKSGGVRDFMLQTRPFTPGVPETRNFPLQTWERLQRQVLKEYGTQALTHAHPQGVEALRCAIADYVNLERGAKAAPGQVLVLTSSQQALTLCAQVLLDAGDSIYIEDPAYHGARKAFDAAGLVCRPVSVDAQGMMVEHLHRDGAKAACLTPSHQYPTGVTLSLDRRLTAIEWARQQGAWLIEDDYDSEFHYHGKPTACVQGLDEYERTLYIGTFTKSLFPGLRIGYMVLPLALVEPMTVARTLMDGHNAPLAQLTLARFIESGHFSAHIRNMRSLYAARRVFLVQLLRAHLAGIIEPLVPDGGMQMSCVLLRDIPEQAVIDKARRAGIDLFGLSALYAHEAGKRGFVMGFAAYTPLELEAAVRKLAEVLR